MLIFLLFLLYCFFIVCFVKMSVWVSLLKLGTVFLFSFCILLFCLSQLPPLPEEYRSKVTLPRSIEDAQILRDALLLYIEASYYHSLFAVIFLYLFLQTFSVPGSIFLNVVSGAVFGLPVGLIATHTAACCGASLAYFISFLIGRPIAQHLFPDRLESFQVTLDTHRDNLFNYILFLRLTPFLPNWFINLASPVLFVPFKTFFFATYLGKNTF
jgi:hypothetical protein